MGEGAMDDPYFRLDRTIHHPSHKVPILTWWAGIYDHVFIALHPFFRVPGLKGLGSKPFPSDDLIKSSGQPVPWSEVHRAVAPEGPRDTFYRAAWLLSVLGYAERANIDLQTRIENYCARESLFLPQEYGLAPILEPTVGNFLARLGSSSVVAWDEFRENSIELELSTFDRSQPHYRLPRSITSSRIWGLHNREKGLLLTWEFDSTDALIALTTDALSLAKPEEFFEGWYADEKTYCDVLNPPEFIRRES